MLGLVASLAFFFPAIDQIDVPIKHYRASFLAARFDRMARDMDVTCEARDLEGILRLRGTEDNLAKARDMLALFDVKAREVAVRFQITCEVDKIDYSGTVNVTNNVQFTFGDNRSGAEVKLVCRVNDNNTLNCWAIIKVGEAKFERIQVAKSGEPLVFKLPEMISLNEAAQQFLKSKDKRELPVLRITPTVIEPPLPKAGKAG